MRISRPHTEVPFARDSLDLFQRYVDRRLGKETKLHLQIPSLKIGPPIAIAKTKQEEILRGLSNVLLCFTVLFPKFTSLQKFSEKNYLMLFKYKFSSKSFLL